LKMRRKLSKGTREHENSDKRGNAPTQPAKLTKSVPVFPRSRMRLDVST
jgi:hypothetical protein